MARRIKEKPEDFKKRMQESGETKERAKANMYLTGGQAKLDKNKNNKLDAQDFKILRAEKAKGRGQGLQDEKMKPGRTMKAMGGGMMMRPMGYSKGKSVMAKGCKLGRKKPTKMY